MRKFEEPHMPPKQENTQEQCSTIHIILSGFHQCLSSHFSSPLSLSMRSQPRTKRGIGGGGDWNDGRATQAARAANGKPQTTAPLLVRARSRGWRRHRACAIWRLWWRRRLVGAGLQVELVGLRIDVGLNLEPLPPPLLSASPSHLSGGLDWARTMKSSGGRASCPLSWMRAATWATERRQRVQLNGGRPVLFARDDEGSRMQQIRSSATSRSNRWSSSCPDERRMVTSPAGATCSLPSRRDELISSVSFLPLPPQASRWCGLTLRKLTILTRNRWLNLASQSSLSNGISWCGVESLMWNAGAERQVSALWKPLSDHLSSWFIISFKTHRISSSKIPNVEVPKLLGFYPFLKQNLSNLIIFS